MAIGGSHKGNGNGNRGKPYGLMLLLAFGAALLGVMVLHKLRERRIFHLLVKEKDNELISLKFLLQKERERSKEMKRKTEEMKAKLYSLRTQKMELDRRVVEMQSTIGSIKDEQKIMESVLEEKQNEIKMLGEMNKDAEKETLQMVALTESLKQKEAEIEDLKHRLHECSDKIWSASTDDPSSPPLNLTVTSSMVNKDKVEVGKSNEEVVQLHESVYGGNGLNSTRDNGGNATSTKTEGGDAARFENASESRVGITDRKEVFGEEQSQTIEGSRKGSTVGIDNDQGYRIESSQEKGASGAGVENNASIATETIVIRAGRLSKTADGDIDEKSIDGEGKVTQYRQLGLENVQEAEDRQGTFRGGAKLETADSSRSKGKEKYHHASTVRGKRGTMAATNRLLENSHENNGVEKMRNIQFSSDNQGILINREEGRGYNDGKTEEKTKAVDSSDAKSVERQHPEDSKDLENELREDGTNHQTSEVHETSKRLRIAHDGKVLTNGSLDGQLSNTRSNDRKQSLDEGQQHEDEQQDHSTQESRNSRNMNKKGNSDERAKLITENEREEEMEDSNTEHEADAGAGDFYKNSVSDLEEDKEEYKEETDESEF